MLENNESPKSTYFYRAVVLAASTKLYLEARGLLPHRLTGADKREGG